MYIIHCSRGLVGIIYVSPVEVEAIDFVAIAHVGKLVGGDNHYLVLPSVLHREPMLMSRCTIVARLTCSIVVHATHSRRIATCRDCHHIRVEPIDAQKLIPARTALSFPIEGKHQIGDTIRHQDITICINTGFGTAISVESAPIV